MPRFIGYDRSKEDELSIKFIIYHSFFLNGFEQILEKFVEYSIEDAIKKHKELNAQLLKKDKDVHTDYSIEVNYKYDNGKWYF